MVETQETILLVVLLVLHAVFGVQELEDEQETVVERRLRWVCKRLNS